jgi:L-galactose dehydrogenase/L-glyceraldehyde 3-phosphate reductase
MEQRRFGRTGWTVPVITYGGGWVGGLIIRAPVDVREATLERAVAAGIDWIDTAASYGAGASERVIGEWLAKRSGNRPRISTKFNIDTTAGAFAAQVENSVADSLARLKLSSVPLLILHNRIVAPGNAGSDNRGLTPAQVLEPDGVADIMDRLRDKGLTQAIGLTGLGDPAALAEVVASGRFDVIQIYYNLLNPTALEPAGPGWNSTDFDGLMHRCVAQDMGMMGIRIFAGGHLASSERHGREVAITANAENAAEEARARAALEVLGQSHGTPAQAALRFGLACPLLSTIEVGIGETWHLDQALAAVEMGPLPPAASEALARLRANHRAFRRGS